MNAIAKLGHVEQRPGDALGWRPNVERLRAECDSARRQRRSNPWAVVEAECWLQLIDAELSAQSTQNDPTLCAELFSWRAEVTKILAQLRAIGRAGMHAL